jgi:hypothetical protein
VLPRQRTSTHATTPADKLDTPEKVTAWWQLARRLSPRPQLRVDTAGADGAWRHAYQQEEPLGDEPPAGPYAIYLTDRRGRFRLLCFDLDSKRGPVHADVAALLAWCRDAGLRPLPTRSGPTGGHHIWLILDGPAPAALVDALARAAARRLPTLDIAPLANRRTGCARPPGAPHRTGGRSTPLISLTEATALADHPDPVDALERLLTLLEADRPRPAGDTARRRAGLDDGGLPYLLGERRPLPPPAKDALHTPPPNDASATLASILTSAALARWRYTDVAELLPTAAGLEHARSRPDGRRRIPRPADEAAAVLLRQWRRAVTFAAGLPPAPPTARGDFDTRAADIVDQVTALQTRADASPGRWARPGGPADRRILDALCLLALRGLTDIVEADIRRLAMLTGIGRETARVALHRLADGWLTFAVPAEGPRAAHWALANTTPAPSTDDPTHARSQAIPRPVGAAGTTRTAWIDRLTATLTTIAHDTFTPAGLGHHPARIYQTLTADLTTPTHELAAHTGYDGAHLTRMLHQLEDTGLARHDGQGWRRGRTHLDTAAETLQVTGILADRIRRYADERELWAWWLDELTWMHLPRRDKRRAGGGGQLSIIFTGLGTRSRHGRMPRRSTGRADLQAAMYAVRTSRGQNDTQGDEAA